MKLFLLLCLVCYTKLTNSLLFNGNSTWKDFLKCKEYDVFDGYNYREFLRIDDFVHKNVTELDNDIMINIEVAVLAVRDAHILLSATTSPTNDSPVYEIVLGAGSNTFSELRRLKKKQPLKTKSTMNILSQIRPIPINIIYTRSGRLNVFTNGEPFPLLSYVDPTVIDVKYISFCSWGSAEAKWFYDCEPKENASTNHIEPMAKNLTALQRIREKFWSMSLLNQDEPETPTNVTIQFKIENLDYNLDDSLLTVRGVFNFQWYDIRNSWDPDEFDNIKIYRGFVPIWYPNFELVNGKAKDAEIDTGFRYTIFSNGTVDAISKPIEINTWCLEKLRQNSWPNDDQYCSIRFGTRNKYVQLVHMNNDRNEFEVLPGSGKWKINVHYHRDRLVGLAFWEFNLNNVTTKYERSLLYIIELQRNQHFIGKCFFTPLICSLALISFSFWIDHPYRGGLSLTGTIVQLAMFITMSKYAPHDYVPVIVRYYHIGFYFSWMNIIFIIISTWFHKHPPANPPKLWILNVIDDSFLRKILFLGDPVPNDEFNGQQLPWIELTKIFDRLLFILLLMLIVIILVRGY